MLDPKICGQGSAGQVADSFYYWWGTIICTEARRNCSSLEGKLLSIFKRCVFLSLLVTLSACLYTERKPAIYIEPKGYYIKARQYGEWAARNAGRLAVYIGKSEEDVLADFGKPSFVKQDAWLHGEKYSHS